MIAFWESVVRPLIEAAAPKVIAEVGVYGGDVTRRLLTETEATVHAIDPEPARTFDPDELRQRHGERFVFHQRPSLNVLPEIEGIDVALLDGDHNWYTVYSELRLLAEHDPFPLTFVHDVDWPYGRRDLYYVPERIPDEFRQPHKVGGMLLGQSELIEGGGFNAIGDHALHEGGARNGIRTAVEDFLSETSVGFQDVVGFHGLGILGASIELESPVWLREQLRLIEEDWIRTAIELADTRRELRDARGRALRRGADSGSVLG